MKTILLKSICSLPCFPTLGILLSVDNYYNVQLADTEEWIDGAMMGNLGEVLIRYEEQKEGRQERETG